MQDEGHDSVTIDDFITDTTFLLEKHRHFPFESVVEHSLRTLREKSADANTKN